MTIITTHNPMDQGKHPVAHPGIAVHESTTLEPPTSSAHAASKAKSTPSHDEKHQGDDRENQHNRDQQTLGHWSTSSQSLSGFDGWALRAHASRPEHVINNEAVDEPGG